jgi:hypothetical protein
MKANPEFDKFDTVMRTILSVSREELKRREQKWKQNRERRKRAKTSPASHASNGKD